MRKNKLYLLFFLGFVLFVYRHILTFHPIAFGDLIYLYPQNLHRLIYPLTYALSPGADGFGINTIPTLWFYWTFFPFSIFQHVFSIPFNISFPILFSLPFLFFSAFSIFKMGNYIHLSFRAKVLAALFYLLNSYILMVVDGGQIGVAYAYSFFPFSLYLIIKALRHVTFENFLLAVLTFSILVFLDLRVALLAMIVVLLFVIYNLSELFGVIRRVLLFLLPSIILFVLIHSFWILPIYLYPASLNQFSQSSGDFAQLSFLTILNSLLLFQPHYPINDFGNLQMVSLPFAFIVILIFTHLLFRNNRKVYFFDFCALIAIFLTKGIQYPFGFVNEFLFNNIIGFSLFRDPSKFMIITALCYSLLLGVSYDTIRAKISKAGHLFFGLVCVLLLIALFPLLQRSSAGLLTTNSYNPLWEKLMQKTIQEESFFRRIWVPDRPVFGFSDNEHPGLIAKNMSETPLFHFLNNDSYDRFHFIYNPLTASYFDTLGIGEIVVDKNRNDYKLSEDVYVRSLNNYLNRQLWLEKVEDNSVYSKYKNEGSLGRVYFAKDMYLIEGGFERMYDLFAIDSDFIKKGIYTFPKPGENLVQYSNYKNVVTIRTESEFDLSLENYLQTNFNALQPIQNKWGEINNLESWHLLLKEKSIKSWDIETENQFQKIYHSNISGEMLVFKTKDVGSTIYFKLFSNSQGGEVQIRVANQDLTFNTDKSIDSFEWIEIPFGDTIEIKNVKGFNAVGDFFVVHDKSKVMENVVPTIGSLVYLFNNEKLDELKVGRNGTFDIRLLPNSKHDRLIDLYRNGEILTSFQSTEGLDLSSVELARNDIIEIKNNDIEIEPLALYYSSKKVQNMTKQVQVIESEERVEKSSPWFSFETDEFPVYENNTYSIETKSSTSLHYKIRLKYYNDEHFLFEKEIVDGVDIKDLIQKNVLVPRAVTKCKIEVLWAEGGNNPEFFFTILSKDSDKVIKYALLSENKLALKKLFSNNNLENRNWKVLDPPHIDLNGMKNHLDKEYHYLVLSDRYDQSWQLEMSDGTQIDPFKVNGFSQAFFIDDVNDVDKILYLPQELVNNLVKISVIGTIILLSLIIGIKLRRFKKL